MCIYNLSSTLDGTQKRNPKSSCISTLTLLPSNGENSDSRSSKTLPPARYLPVYATGLNGEYVQSIIQSAL